MRLRMQEYHNNNGSLRKFLFNLEVLTVIFALDWSLLQVDWSTSVTFQNKRSLVSAIIAEVNKYDAMCLPARPENVWHDIYPGI